MKKKAKPEPAVYAARTYRAVFYHPALAEAGEWMARKLLDQDQLQKLALLEMQLRAKSVRRWSYQLSWATAKKPAVLKAWVLETLKFPFGIDLPTGSTSKNENVLTQIETGRSYVWEYVWSRVRVNDLQELAVLAASIPLWMYLRKTKQVPGRLSRTQACREGIVQLTEFRNQRAKEA